MKISNEFVLNKIGDTFCVVPIGSKKNDFNGIFRLNESGCFIWEQISQGADLSLLIEKFAEKYGLSYETAVSDVTEFLDFLRKNKILE